MSTPLPNEQELLLLISDGDEAAFRSIFHLYGDMVHANIFSVVKSQAITKDLVQDSFLRVWLYRDKLPEIKNFKAWLLRISYNRAFSYLKDIQTQQKGAGSYAEKYGLHELRNATEETMQLNILSGIIKKTVNSLPAQQKKIYRLSREEGLTIATIAAQLDLSEQTVKNTLVRALKALRQAIDEAGLALLLFFLFQ